MLKYIPKSGRLLRLCPHGISGEFVRMTGTRAHVRVKLPGHTDLNPSTMVIVAPWNRFEVVR